MKNKSYCLYMIEPKTRKHIALFCNNYNTVLYNTSLVLKILEIEDLFKILSDMCELADNGGCFLTIYTIPTYFVNLILKPYNLLIDIGQMPHYENEGEKR